MSNSIKDALKKLYYKMTGKKSNKESISDVIDDITKDYEGGKTYYAGNNISISDENVISAVDTKYTAGNGIVINNNVISCSQSQTDLYYIKGMFLKSSAGDNINLYFTFIGKSISALSSEQRIQDEEMIQCVIDCNLSGIEIPAFGYYKLSGEEIIIPECIVFPSTSTGVIKMRGHKVDGTVVPNINLPGMVVYNPLWKKIN